MEFLSFITGLAIRIAQNLLIAAFCWFVWQGIAVEAGANSVGLNTWFLLAAFGNLTRAVYLLLEQKYQNLD